MVMASSLYRQQGLRNADFLLTEEGFPPNKGYVAPVVRYDPKSVGDPNSTQSTRVEKGNVSVVSCVLQAPLFQNIWSGAVHSCKEFW